MSSPSRSRRLSRRWWELAAILTATALVGAGAAAAVVGTSSRGTAATERWSFAPRMPHRRSYTASAELGGKIYVAAGMVGNTGRPLNIFERFDPATDEWTSLPFVPESFRAAAGAALGGRFYVFGGSGTARTMRVDGRQVFAYDVARRSWSRRASLPAPRTNLTVVPLRGKLYAIGGLDPVQPTADVFVYDPGRNRWSRASSLPEKLHAHAAVVFRGEIWVIGGRNRAGQITRHVWIYNARANRWRAGPQTPVPLETAGAAVADGKVYVVLEEAHLVYDAATRRWTRGPSLQVPRHAMAVFAIKGTLYAMGGCIVPQLEDSSVVERLELG
jgi:N-acetylneuraminic acid mutarotase